MSWSQAGYAVTVEDTGDATLDPVEPPVDPEPATITSLSPLLLTHSSGLYYLRAYGVDVFELSKSGGSQPFDPGPAPCPGSSISDWCKPYETAADKDYIVYCDSDSHAYGEFAGTIFLDKRGTVGSLANTCVPAQLKGLTFFFACATDAATGSSELATTDDLEVTYRDPQVIELPNQQGYLMVLARYLHRADVIAPAPNDSRSQIVLWWADTPDFTGPNVVGPFTLVDDLRSWHDDQTIRLWVGVPGIALVDREGEGPTFYVYYVIETTEIAYGGKKCGSGLNDTIAKDDYDIALGHLEDSWGTFKPGIACKRFSWDALMGAVEAERDGGRTFRTMQEVFWPYHGIDGDLLGTVNFWFADGTYEDLGYNTLALSVTPFFYKFPSRCARFAAPHPLTCGTPESLSLYVAVTMRDKHASDCGPVAPTESYRGRGQGIWRGRAAPHSRWIYDSVVGAGLTKSVFGRDFLFAPLRDGQSEDMIAASDDPTLWIDPGPLQLEDRSFWVIAGIQDLDANEVSNLTAFTGGWSDGCLGWYPLYASTSQYGDAWTTTGKVLTPPGFVLDKTPMPIAAAPLPLPLVSALHTQLGAGCTAPGGLGLVGVACAPGTPG